MHEKADSQVHWIDGVLPIPASFIGVISTLIGAALATNVQDAAICLGMATFFGTVFVNYLVAAQRH